MRVGSDTDSLPNGYVRIEYHPKSKRGSRILSPEEFKAFSSNNEEPTVPLDGQPWRPFRSREDFKFAELAHAAALSKGQIDTLVKLIKRCERNPGSLTFEGVKDVEQSWEDASKLLTPVSSFHTDCPVLLTTIPYLIVISLHSMRLGMSLMVKHIVLTPGHALCGGGSLITLWTQTSYDILSGMHRRF